MRVFHRRIADTGRLLCRSFVFAGLASLLLSSPSRAATVLTFGQTNPADVANLVNDGLGTPGSSTLNTLGNADGGGLSIPITITNFLGSAVTIPAFETFEGIHSTGAATASAGTDTQPFAGVVAITSLPGGLGANYLTATFSNTMMGMNTVSGPDGGIQASLTASQPPAGLTFTSDFASFGPPNGMGITFTNVTPPTTIFNSSLGAFPGPTTMTTAGNFSAFTTSIVPEPSTFLAAGIGGLGFIGYGLRRRKASGA